MKIAVFNPLSEDGYTPLKYIKRKPMGIIGFSGKNASKYQAFEKVRYKNKYYSLYHSNQYGGFIRLSVAELRR